MSEIWQSRVGGYLDVHLYYCSHLFVYLKCSIKRWRQRRCWVCSHPEVSQSRVMESSQKWQCGSCLARTWGPAWQILWQLSVTKSQTHMHHWLEPVVHSPAPHLKMHLVTHPFLQKRPADGPAPDSPQKGLPRFIKTKEIASGKRDSVTTCQFTSAGTCQRMTQKAATCHPLPEQIKLLFVKHLNSNQ